jgi:hypothetical protein
MKMIIMVLKKEDLEEMITEYANVWVLWMEKIY